MSDTPTPAVALGAHRRQCNSCGTVVPFESCNIESLYPTVSAQTDFQISSHMLELFGLCGSCRA